MSRGGLDFAGGSAAEYNAGCGRAAGDGAGVVTVEQAATTGGTGRAAGFLLFGLCAAGFLAATVGISITPFLLAMAEDLSTDIAAVSFLFTFSNLTWAGTALAAGPISDRLGRKPVMLFGLVMLALSCFGGALATDYRWLALARLVTGLGGGSLTPTIFAAAADLFPSAQRGKALGWIMTGQSMSLLAGAPLSALIGSFSNWRWSLATLGLTICLTLIALVLLLPSPPRRPAGLTRREAGLRALVSSPRVLALFAAGTCERVCYSSVVVFLATYLIVTYGVSLQWLAGALLLVALGNVLGNQLGGRLADRVRSKYAVVVVLMLANSLLALPLLLIAPGVAVSIGVGALYNLANSAARPSLMWLISELSRESRGAVMGLNVTVAGMGWLIASSIGGWLVAGPGFGALGLLAAISGACSAGLALFAARAGRTSRPAPTTRMAASP